MNVIKISQYGMNIEDVNNAIETALRVTSLAGLIYEGERRFDLVCKVGKELPEPILPMCKICNSVHTGKSNSVLSQVANISFEPGPVQIQREQCEAPNLLLALIHVRDRDVQELLNRGHQSKLMNSKVILPAGLLLTLAVNFQKPTRS